MVDFGPWSDDIDLIHKRAKELRDLLAKDQQCQDFLKAHGIDPFGLLDVANEQGLYNVDALQPNNLKVTNGEAEGDIQAAISPGRPDGYLTTVNSLGAFFHDTYSWGKFTFDLTVDRGRFQGGKEPAQIFTLLHELAHSTIATDHDQGSAALTRQNDKKIEENCKKTIDALKKMK